MGGRESGSRRRNVLIVDDDVQVLRSFTRVLANVASIHTATNAADALACASTRELDACVVDYRLDGESGLELVRALKARRQELKILLMSGYTSIEVAVEAARAGADDVREKPLTPQQLMHWVETGSWVTSQRDRIKTDSLDRATWQHVRRIVSDCNGNQSEAARRLRIGVATVRRHMKRPAPRR